MNRLRWLLTGLAAFLLTAGAVSAQPGSGSAAYSVMVRPEKAKINPGDGLQFEAQLYDDQGTAVQYSDFKWTVYPDSLGKISEDGFFQAGREAGEVKVVASMMARGVRYYGEARVVIGDPQPPLIRVVVTPLDAIVPPGGTQKFHVSAIARDNSNFRIDNIRWAVEPQELGKIDTDGTFYAGQNKGQGVVIAYVDIDNAVYRGVARVTVSDLPSGSIAGTITDENDGSPLAGAHILVQRLGHIRWMKRAIADDQGNYLVEKLIPGLYVVYANAPDYLPEYYDDATYLQEALPVQVSENEAVTGIDMALGHGATITGTVVEDSTGLPIANTLVSARLVTSGGNTNHGGRTHDRGVVRHALTDENGNYTIRSIPAGAFAVFAKAQGYDGEYYDDAATLLEATLLTTSPPDTISNIDFSLALSSAISGTVRDAEDETPIARALVQVYNLVGDRRGNHPIRRTLTDENGNYVVGVPAAGFYLVRVQAHGYAVQYYDGVERYEDATSVQVEENAHTTGIDFDLQRLGSLSGTVVDQETGEAIAGAFVFAYLDRVTTNPTDTSGQASHRSRPDRQRGVYKTRTDSLGNYVFDAIAPGSYFVRAGARGYLPEFWQEAGTVQEATLVDVAVSQEITGIDFTLLKGGAIAGTIYSADDSSSTLAGAGVTVWSEELGIKRHSFSDRDGNYIVEGLPAGEYLVYVSLRGYDNKFYDGVDTREDATPVAVVETQTTGGIDVYLPKFETRFGTITGVVMTEPDSAAADEGSPIAAAFVVAIPVTPGPAHFDITDPFGNFRITNIRPGEYVVFAWASGFLGEFYDDARSWENAQRLLVNADDEIGNINFALAEAEQGPYRIRGVVRRRNSQNREGVQGAVVFAMGQNGIAASAVTGADGSYSMDNLPAGTYKIRISGAGMQTSWYGGATENEAEPVVLESGNMPASVDLEVDQTVTSVDGGSSLVPEVFSLEQNYPNPFNPSTTIRFSVPVTAKVTLRIYNVLGQNVRTLVNETLEAGVHTVQWLGVDDNGRQLSSGVYLLQLEAGDVHLTKRMVLMK